MTPLHATTAAPTAASLVQAIQSALPDAQAAWLFGSAVRGEMHAESDIDIAVWLPNAWTVNEKIAAYALLSDQLKAPVDLLDFRRLPTVMQVQILETGALLFSHHPAALEMYCARIRTEYLHIQRWRQPMIERLAAELSQHTPLSAT